MKSGMGILFLFIISACGDRTAEQYNREKVDAEYAKILPIVGSYTGSVKSAATDIGIANIRLVLNADKKILEKSDQSTAAQQTGIAGTLTFDGSISASISFINGVYDPDNQKFQLQLPIERRNGQSVTLNLSGQFDSNKIIGKIFIKEYPETGGEFIIQRSNDIPKSIIDRNSEALPEDSIPLQWVGYAGLKPDKVNLFLVAQFLSDEEKIVSLLSPVKLFSGGLNFSGIVRATFTNAIWDSRLGTLKAEGIIGSEEHGDQQISLNCVSFLTEEKASGWNCSYINLNGGVFFSIKFLPELI